MELLGTGVDFAGADALTEPGGLGAFGLGGVGSLGSPLALGPLGGLGGAGGMASVGQASSLGALSVPQSWPNAAPLGSVSAAFRPVAMALPESSASTVQEVLTATPGNTYSDMALAGMAGRALGSTAGLGRRDRPVGPAGERTESAQRPLGRTAAGVAAELREVAELLRELAALRDSGILTDEEFNEQKRRLLGQC